VREVKKCKKCKSKMRKRKLKEHLKNEAKLLVPSNAEERVDHGIDHGH
jgi:hypothetical protein